MLNPTQDGAAILWSERPSHKIFSKSGLATEASSAAGLPVDGQHGRYMVPAAIMRGHSGSHVWRLNVHDFTPDSTDAKHEGSDNVCAGRDGGVSAAKKKRRAMVLMATGGNDGALKIWDLRFEAACERRPPWQSRFGSGPRGGERGCRPRLHCTVVLLNFLRAYMLGCGSLEPQRVGLFRKMQSLPCSSRWTKHVV